MKITINYTFKSLYDGRGNDGTGYPWKSWSVFDLKDGTKDCVVKYAHSKMEAKNLLINVLKAKLETKDPTPEEVEI